VVFLTVSMPAMLLLGLPGYAIGVATVTATQVGLRSYYMRRLFGSFSALRQLAQAVLPTIPAAGLVLGLRVLAHGERSLPRAAAELALFTVVAALATFLLERPLVLELVGYLRKRTARSAGGVSAREAQYSPV
jgi:hypothetical protein